MLIGAFADRVGLSADTLRYYEQIGLMPNVGRTPSGRRSYSADHIAWVEFLNILKATGMGVRDMARYVELRSYGLSSLAERHTMLVTHLELVTAKRRELETTEAVLKEKINLFQSVLDGEIDGATLHCAKGDQR